MSTTKQYDVIVIGGGPVGLAATYEVAKSGKSVLVLEQNNFFNQAGSSPDLVRMFRTMYTEDYMADLAKTSMEIWDSLERDAGESLRWMTGLLNFGDPELGTDTPEGTLKGPIDNLNRLNMRYEELTVEQIEKRWPFKNLPSHFEGLYAPDNGVINVPLLTRTLLRLAKDYDADAKQHTQVTQVKYDSGSSLWNVHGVHHVQKEVTYKASKIIIANGAYVNHVLKPSFGVQLDLDIWEMTASYFNTNAGPNGTLFPSMWFQFQKDDENKRSRLFYGFPAVPWGNDNMLRIAVDAASPQRRIKDPNERKANVIEPQDVADTQKFVRDHVVGVDSSAPVFNSNCLQTNVADNMFVLDYIPEEYLGGGPQRSVAIFTAGWAMKFVPLLGKALADMVLEGGSEFALEQFLITREDKDGNPILKSADESLSSFSARGPGVGSSVPCRAHHMGH